MSPWGENKLAELAEDMDVLNLPDSVGSVEEERERFNLSEGGERERVRLGIAYFQNQNYDDAVETLTFEYRNDNLSLVAAEILGLIFISRHAYVKGADQWAPVAAAHSELEGQVFFSQYVAMIYSEHCMHQQAIPHIERLLVAEPWDIYQWVQLGWNYGGLGDFEKAREVFAQTRQAIADGAEADPHDIAELDAYSGFVEWNAGNTQAAKTYFEEALKSPHAPPSARHALDALNAGSEPFYARW